MHFIKPGLWFVMGILLTAFACNESQERGRSGAQNFLGGAQQQQSNSSSTVDPSQTNPQSTLGNPNGIGNGDLNGIFGTNTDTSTNNSDPSTQNNSNDNTNNDGTDTDADTDTESDTDTDNTDKVEVTITYPRIEASTWTLVIVDENDKRHLINVETSNKIYLPEPSEDGGDIEIKVSVIQNGTEYDTTPAYAVALYLSSGTAYLGFDNEGDEENDTNSTDWRDTDDIIAMFVSADTDHNVKFVGVADQSDNINLAQWID